MDNSDRVGRARRLLASGLRPFVSREFVKHYKGRSAQELQGILKEPVQDAKARFTKADSADLLKIMRNSWNEVFRHVLEPDSRNLVFELLTTRHHSAHEKEYSADDAYRALGSTHRMLTAVSAPEEADEVERMKMEVLRELAVEEERGQHPQPSAPSTRRSRPRNWAEKGTINDNRQENLGRVEPQRQSPKTRQYIHRMKCLECGGEYHSWSGDIHHRRCPHCDRGAPGPDLSEGNVVG